MVSCILNFLLFILTYLNCPDKLNGRNLSHILEHIYTEIVTNIENNVKQHFFQYIKRFVNSSFKLKRSQLLSSTFDLNEKSALNEQFNRDLFVLKQDLLNKTSNSSGEFKEWLDIHRPHIFYRSPIFNPLLQKTPYEVDIEANPQAYLPGMIYMCLALEQLPAKWRKDAEEEEKKLGINLEKKVKQILQLKSFQFFPLRTNILPKYIPINTSALVDLLIPKGKKKYLDNINLYKEELWNRFFKIDHPSFYQSKYTFSHRILTDGVGVSLQLIHDNFIEVKEQRQRKAKEGCQATRERRADMTVEEIDQDRIDTQTTRREKEIARLSAKAQAAYQRREAFKALSQEDRERILAEQRANSLIEFPYLEELSPEQTTELRYNNWVVCDPGRRVLFYMKNEDGVKLKYTNKTHIKETKRLKYQKILQNYRDKTGISAVEQQLNTVNAKSCDWDTFGTYIRLKNQVNHQLFEAYQAYCFRKYKWFAFINRQKAETKLVQKIKKTFGNDAIMVMGDWSDKLGKTPSRIKYISTPNKKLKRKLAEHMTIYDIDEYRTSCLNHKTELRCKNMYLRDKKGITRKLHAVLSYKTRSNRLGYINRDLNAVNNMEKIVQAFIEGEPRPLRYQRGYELPEEQEIKLLIRRG